MQLVAEKIEYPIHKSEEKHRRSRFQLAKLLRCTEEMLTCAENGDWESVEEMEISRKEELASCFIETADDNSIVIVEALAALIHLNGKILELVQEAKANMISERQKFLTSKSAINNYRSSQDIPD